MKVTVVEGDGIGKEVIPSALKVLKAIETNLKINIEQVPVELGYDKWEKIGVAITDLDLDIIKSCDCILFGAITTPPDPNYKSVLVKLRKELDLYANIRPFKTYSSISQKYIDFIIVRENTEGMYSGIEEIKADVALSTRVISRKGSERIAKYGCEIAKKRKNQITIVHKANILKSCGFFRDICIDIAKNYNIEYKERLVDAMCYDLILHPDKYDVIVTTNLFGDILSDLSAALIGGLGLCPSANLGYKYALFEPVHGSAPDIAGQGKANPIAAILSIKMMLEWAGETENANIIERAVKNVLFKGIKTPDLGGNNTTKEVTDAISREIELQLL
ncbi:MAG TPA: isocitrate/isopropylmalate dehydrogenase family protein [Methanosarcinales archaeon]|nr:isocitrate/isopropylmalate dehydrogenase family protein [Methanosarcinales archaeon]